MRFLFYFLLLILWKKIDVVSTIVWISIPIRRKFPSRVRHPRQTILGMWESNGLWIWPLVCRVERLRTSFYNTLTSKICVKLLMQASKNSDSNAQHFLSDLLTHSWFHSMIFALPGFQFPYTVMNRYLHLRSTLKYMVLTITHHSLFRDVHYCISYFQCHFSIKYKFPRAMCFPYYICCTL